VRTKWASGKSWKLRSEGESACLAPIARRQGQRRSASTLQALAIVCMTHGAHQSAGSTLAPPLILFAMLFTRRATIVSVCRMATALCPSIRVNAAGWAIKES
jgi:hypothetical protein